MKKKIVFIIFIAFVFSNIFSFQYVNKKYNFTIELDEEWKKKFDEGYNVLFNNGFCNLEILISNKSNFGDIEYFYLYLKNFFKFKGHNPKIYPTNDGYNVLMGYFKFYRENILYSIHIRIYEYDNFFYLLTYYGYNDDFYEHLEKVKINLETFTIIDRNKTINTTINTTNTTKTTTATTSNTKSENDNSSNKSSTTTSNTKSENDNKLNKNSETSNTKAETTTRSNITEDKKNQETTKEKPNEIDNREKYIAKLKVSGIYVDIMISKYELEQSINELEKFKNQGNPYKYFGVSYDDPDRNFKLWSMFYREVMKTNMDRLNEIVNYFNQLAKTKNYDSYKLAEEIIKTVQNIDYERPYNIVNKDSASFYFDFFTPHQVFHYKKGDCDSKTILLALILKKLGYDVGLYYSSKYSHAMLALGSIESTGTYFIENNKKYYFVETTYPGWKIGIIPPDMSETKYWSLIRL